MSLVGRIDDLAPRIIIGGIEVGSDPAPLFCARYFSEGGLLRGQDRDNDIRALAASMSARARVGMISSGSASGELLSEGTLANPFR
jgi:hypothetical protein